MSVRNSLMVNCLVQVTTNNQNDFTEWLEYHIALGFDMIYVFDTGVTAWLDVMCDKYRDHVILVPRDDWRKKSVIVEKYTSRRRAPEWAVCLSDNEFIWLDIQKYGSIKRFLNVVGPDVGALTAYTKYLSSEKPMKNRIGTQIDCFTHSRPNPQGRVAPNELTPNTGVTFFHIVNPQVMPLESSVVPRTSHWIDGVGGRLTREILAGRMTSNEYDPARYPIRCYKYALRSGVEMEFKPGTKPTGYTVSDPSMQEARELLMQIPVNLKTEELFAKDEIIVTDDKSKPISESVQYTPEQIAEHSLPLTAGKIDSMILGGYFLDDVVAYLNKNELQFDSDALARVFDRERKNIIESSPVYTEMQRMLNDGISDEDVKARLQLTNSTYAKMRIALMVLDIQDTESEVVEQPTETPVAVPASEQKIDVLVENFEEQLSKTELSAEQKAQNAEKFAEKDSPKKKKPTKKKKTEPKPALKPETEPVIDNNTGNAPADVGVPGLDSLLDDVDLESLTNK